MLKQAISLGFNIATLPARITYNVLSNATGLHPDIGRLIADIRQASGDVVRELQQLADSVEAELQQKAGHLNPEQKQQAAQLALYAAEQHLSMAARDLLRALWLNISANNQLTQQKQSQIEQP